MPEMPEVQAHAERLTEEFAGLRLRRFTPLTFTALKTAVPGPRRRTVSRCSTWGAGGSTSSSGSSR